MTSLSAEEILHWNDTTAKQWHTLLNQHPEALALPCDIRECATVAEVLQHIVAAELRYAERLSDEPITDYADIPKSDAAAIFATHDCAMAKVRALLADEAYDWEREVPFVTRSAGTLIATRRTFLFHALLHSVRHYAQLATLLRHQGIKADLPMDYLFMAVRQA
jgi:uncharacterized damage-inducible protein DinB